MLAAESKEGRVGVEWHLEWPCLPPNVNHVYGVRPDGGRYVTDHARAIRTVMRAMVTKAGFEPDIKKRYGVRVVLTFGTDNSDIDGCIKSLLDLVFTSRRDHRVYRLEVDKRVERGQQRTEMDIWEMEGDGG